MNAPTYVDGDAPGVKNLFDTYVGFMRSEHQDPEISRTLEQQIRRLDRFDNVHTAITRVTLGAVVELPDPAVPELSAILTRSFLEACAGELSDAARQFGITKEMQKAAREEAATHTRRDKTDSAHHIATALATRDYSPAAAPAVGWGSSYGPQSGTEEWDRLDYQYAAIRDYFVRQTLSGAPCAGSGAWAIHAAQEFPEAEVVAADIAPIPPRPPPPNVNFERVDITAPLPFKPGSFDVVHVRFVICHLSHGDMALARIAELVAPGGWLLIEDMNAPAYTDGDVPGVKNMFAAYPEYMRTKDQNPEISRTLEQRIRGLDGFDDVNVETTRVPLGAAVDVPGERCQDHSGDTMYCV
ncbi:hypothetical protein EWM64_g10030 [Hericium alpestre]|uniref:Methyltransferase domain-containing protein n=1 Tax=Hericium alpestre TaxID=135208 RepID=A0A4Y9ZH88_9AGAM|nr:hypothetical protein EWM64_g10030 [Hericium alpestre]